MIESPLFWRVVAETSVFPECAKPAFAQGGIVTTSGPFPHPEIVIHFTQIEKREVFSRLNMLRPMGN